MFKDLAVRMRDEDIIEQFVRSSGPGGQNVNKVATCVVLTHRPTGIQVKCQSERSQFLNRIKARQILAQELARRVREERSRIVAEREKLRRKNRKKPASLKRRILEQKHRRSEIKGSRREGRAALRDYR